MNNIDALFVGGSFPMPNSGGSINYVYHLLSGIDPNDLNIIVLTSNFDKVENKKFDSGFNHKVIRSRFGYHVIKDIPFIKRYIYQIIFWFVIFFYVIKYHPRYLIFTEFRISIISYFLVRAFKKVNLGLITYGEEINMIIKSNSKLQKALLRKSLICSKIIISVCDYTSDLLTNFVNKELNITKIIPPIEFREKGSYKRDRNTINLLTVSRLEERKGHLDVLEALKRLLVEYPNLHYSIVGCGDYDKVIKDYIISNNLQDFVKMKGRIGDQELINEYSNADIFVLHHKLLSDGNTEGCPTVFLEAGTFSLPVVGGEAGGVSDAIIHGKTGFICKINTDDLYFYLRKLIDEKELCELMGENGYNYAIQFSIQHQSKKLQSLLKN